MLCQRRIIILVALLLCSCGPQLPEYRDPLVDLTTARGVDVPEDGPVKAKLPVALTLGSNVEAFLKYSDEGRAYAASVGAGQKLLAEADPQYLVRGAVAAVKRRYPKVVSVDDLASAANQRFGTTIVIDIKNKAGMFPGDKTTVEIVLIALNDAQKPISRITGRGAVAIKPYVVPEIRVANDEALQDLNGKVERLLN